MPYLYYLLRWTRQRDNIFLSNLSLIRFIVYKELPPILIMVSFNCMTFVTLNQFHDHSFQENKRHFFLFITFIWHSLYTDIGLTTNIKPYPINPREKKKYHVSLFTKAKYGLSFLDEWSIKDYIHLHIPLIITEDNTSILSSDKAKGGLVQQAHQLPVKMFL